MVYSLEADGRHGALLGAEDRHHIADKFCALRPADAVPARLQLFQCVGHDAHGARDDQLPRVDDGARLLPHQHLRARGCEKGRHSINSVK